MPLAYEYDIDNNLLLVTGWDHVTIGDAVDYFEEVATLPNKLRGCIEYVDFSEVTCVHVCENGAMQLAAAYERVLDRGVVGSVLHATSDNVRNIVEMIVFTFSEVCGGFEEGYRIARQPVPPTEVHAFLKGEEPRLEKMTKVA